MGVVQATISVDVDVLTQDRGDHWSGLIEQTGTTVYGKNEEEVLTRAKDMLGFIISSYHEYSNLNDFRQYLDLHNIQHSIEIHQDDNPPSRVYRYPLRYRPEERFEYVS